MSKPTYEELIKRVNELEQIESEYKRLKNNQLKIQNYFEKLNRSLGEAVFTVKMPERRIEYLNPSAEKIFGYSPQECIGKSTEFLYPDSSGSADFAKKLKFALEEGNEPLFTKQILKRKNGELFTAEITTTFIQSNCEISQAISIIRDISERISIEEKLRESERNFRLVTETIQDVFWISTPGIKEMIYVSPAYDKLWGKSTRQLYDTPRSFLDAIHQEDLTQYLSTIEAYHAKGIAYQCEYRILSNQASMRWIQERGYPITDDNGDTVLMTGLCADITERKQAEVALQESNKILKEAQHFAKIGSWWYNPVTKIPTWTEEMFYIFGFEPQPEALSYDEHRKIIHPDDWERFDYAVSRAVTDGIGYNLELGITRPSGEIRYVNARGKAERDEFGVIKRLIGTTQDITEKKITEEKLIEAHQKLESVIDFLPDSTFVIDNQGIVQMWNRAMTSLTGIRPEEMIGRGSYAYAVPFYGQERPMLIDMVLNWDKHFEDTYTSIEKQSDEVTISHSFHPDLNGGRYLSGTARVLYDAEGKLAGAIESLRDVSEMKRVEMAVRESEEKYRNLFSSIRDAILVADTNREIVEYNPALIDLFGYSEMEILRKPTHVLYADKHQFEELGRMLKENSANPQFFYTVWYRKKSGETFPGETSIYYLKDADGEVTGFIGMIRNVADRLEAEATLKKNEARLKSLVDNLFDAILVADKKGVILFANPAAQTLLGRKGRQIVGMGFGFPIDLDKAFEISIVRPDISVRQVEARATRAEWDGKQTYLISLRDITEKRLVEQERDQINLQLQQSQKIESIGNLAGGIAHDFNNMLSVILGYGQALMEDLHESDPLYDCAKEIVGAGKRSAALTRQLLAFSRKQTLQPEVINLNTIVTNIEKVLRRLIGEDIDLKTMLAEDLASVKVDPGQIEQVIMNLVINARDAMPLGGKLIIETANITLDNAYVEAHVGVVPGSYAMFSFTDTGCGMDKNTREKIFEPFFTTKDKGRGTGLGLSTVYGIVKQSGGNIWVYSEPGQGTTFKIYLPQTTKTISGEKIQKENDSIQGEKELILVVEDEPSLRKLCVKILQILNYRTKAASNGGEALLLIEEKNLKPDLILTDVVMPEMSGKVLIDRLKRSLPDIKVLYMSGYTDNAIVHHGILDEGAPFIQKPFTKDKLGKAIQSILKRL